MKRKVSGPVRGLALGLAAVAIVGIVFWRNAMNAQLMQAVFAGNDAEVERLLHWGANPNAEVPGETALLRACRLGHFGVVKLLVDAGATDTHGGLTYMLYRMGYEVSDWQIRDHKEEYRAIVAFLVAHGAKLNQADFIDHGQTPLCMAVSTCNMVMGRLLVEQGANVNVECGGTWSPLGVSERSLTDPHFTEMAAYLRSKGAKLSSRDKAEQKAALESTWTDSRHQPVGPNSTWWRLRKRANLLDGVEPGAR